MMPSPLLLAAAALLALPSQTAGRPAAPQPARDYSKLNVCQLVSGDAIARTLGGKLAEARPFSDKSWSRCVYLVLESESDKPVGYAVYVQPPEDFEDLKKYIEAPITTLSGLGDGAYVFQDKGDGRFKIHVLKRDDLMFEATGQSAASARKVADAVVAQLWKKAR